MLHVLNVCLAGFALPTVSHLALGFGTNFLFLLIRTPKPCKIFVFCTRKSHNSLRGERCSTMEQVGTVQNMETLNPLRCNRLNISLVMCLIDCING